jgi:hypothetical protein
LAVIWISRGRPDFAMVQEESNDARIVQRAIYWADGWKPRLVK